MRHALLGHAVIGAEYHQRTGAGSGIFPNLCHCDPCQDPFQFSETVNGFSHGIPSGLHLFFYVIPLTGADILRRGVRTAVEIKMRESGIHGLGTETRPVFLAGTGLPAEKIGAVAVGIQIMKLMSPEHRPLLSENPAGTHLRFHVSESDQSLLADARTGKHPGHGVILSFRLQCILQIQKTSALCYDGKSFCDPFPERLLHRFICRQLFSPEFRISPRKQHTVSAFRNTRIVQR